MVKEKYLPLEEEPQQVERPKTPEELRREKWENFWFYNKRKITIGIAAVIALVLAWQPWVQQVEPDYTVGLVSQLYWSDEQIKELEGMLRPYAQDLNGDGMATVNVKFYQINAPASQELSAQEVQANQTRFFGDLQIGDVLVYLCDEANLEFFGKEEHLFAKVDENLTIPGADEKLELSDFSIDWRTCDGIRENAWFQRFTHDYSFCIRAREGTASDQKNYYYASELFVRITQNEPVDNDLLKALIASAKEADQKRVESAAAEAAAASKQAA